MHDSAAGRRSSARHSGANDERFRRSRCAPRTASSQPQPNVVRVTDDAVVLGPGWERGSFAGFNAPLAVADTGAMIRLLDHERYVHIGGVADPAVSARVVQFDHRDGGRTARSSCTRLHVAWFEVVRTRCPRGKVGSIQRASRQFAVQ